MHGNPMKPSGVVLVPHGELDITTGWYATFTRHPISPWLTLSARCFPRKKACSIYGTIFKTSKRTALDAARPHIRLFKSTSPTHQHGLRLLYSAPNMLFLPKMYSIAYRTRQNWMTKLTCTMLRRTWTVRQQTASTTSHSLLRAKL